MGAGMKPHVLLTEPMVPRPMPPTVGTACLRRTRPRGTDRFNRLLGNLDNGRSVVVKINDRGPYTRHRILDLSSRAADALDMKRAGVAAVVVQPFVGQRTPTVAMY